MSYIQSVSGKIDGLSRWDDRFCHRHFFMSMTRGPVENTLDTSGGFPSARSMLVTDVGDEICWRQLWEVDDGWMVDFVTNILYLLALVSGTNILYLQKMSPISKFCHQHPTIITNIKSPTSTCHQHLCSPSHHDIGLIRNDF